MYKYKSVITQEEFSASELSRDDIEDLMTDEFDVYVVEPDGEWPISYNSASDSFQYQTADAIYEVGGLL